MAAQLSYLLTNQLSSDQDALVNYSNVQNLVELGSLVARTANDINSQDVLKRWNLRVTSLLKPTAAPIAGLALANTTTHQSSEVLAQQGITWYSSALSLLSKPECRTESINLLVFMFSEAKSLPDFSREVANPSALSKFVDTLLTLAEDLEAKGDVMEGLAKLVSIYGSTLRPHANKMQNLAISSLQTPGLESSACTLLCNIYMTAGKQLQSGAWEVTMISFLGTITRQVYYNFGIFQSRANTKATSFNHLLTLPAFELSDMTTNGLEGTFEQMDLVMSGLLKMLQTPTEHQVAVPVAQLAEWAICILHMTSSQAQFAASYTSDANSTIPYIEQITYLPKLHMLACKLLAQLSLSVGNRLVYQVDAIVDSLGVSIADYDASNPVRPVLCATSSIVIESCQVSPQLGSNTLSMTIIKAILEDIAAIESSPSLLLQKSNNNNIDNTDADDNQHKNKKAKLSKPDVGLGNPNSSIPMSVKELDRQRCVRGLTTLYRILSSSSSHFIKSSVKTRVKNLLLFIQVKHGDILPGHLVENCLSVLAIPDAISTNLIRGVSNDYLLIKETQKWRPLIPPVMVSVGNDGNNNNDDDDVNGNGEDQSHAENNDIISSVTSSRKLPPSEQITQNQTPSFTTQEKPQRDTKSKSTPMPMVNLNPVKQDNIKTPTPTSAQAQTQTQATATDLDMSQDSTRSTENSRGSSSSPDDENINQGSTTVRMESLTAQSASTGGVNNFTSTSTTIVSSTHEDVQMGGDNDEDSDDDDVIPEIHD